jgi:probable rRNA maturation factor
MSEEELVPTPPRRRTRTRSATRVAAVTEESPIADAVDTSPAQAVLPITDETVAIETGTVTAPDEPTASVEANESRPEPAAPPTEVVSASYDDEAPAANLDNLISTEVVSESADVAPEIEAAMAVAADESTTKIAADPDPEAAVNAAAVAEPEPEAAAPRPARRRTRTRTRRNPEGGEPPAVADDAPAVPVEPAMVAQEPAAAEIASAEEPAHNEAQSEAEVFTASEAPVARPVPAFGQSFGEPQRPIFGSFAAPAPQPQPTIESTEEAAVDVASEPGLEADAEVASEAPVEADPVAATAPEEDLFDDTGVESPVAATMLEDGLEKDGADSEEDDEEADEEDANNVAAEEVTAPRRRTRRAAEPIEVNVVVPRGLGRRVNSKLIQQAVLGVLKREGWEQPCTLDVVIVTDEEMREINVTRRGIDEATDVLSFPLQDLVPGEGLSHDFFVLPPEITTHLGDIVISYMRVESQAEEGGHSREREWAFLTVHGTLHILGYDHDTDERRRAMRRKEEDVLVELGLRRNGS